MSDLKKYFLTEIQIKRINNAEFKEFIVNSDDIIKKYINPLYSKLTKMKEKGTYDKFLAAKICLKYVVNKTCMLYIDKFYDQTNWREVFPLDQREDLALMLIDQFEFDFNLELEKKREKK